MKQPPPKQQLQQIAELIRSGRHEYAKTLLTPLHQAHPHDPEVNWLLADVFGLDGFHAEAAKLLQKLAKRKSGNIRPAPLLQKATSICAHNDLNALGLECAQDWVRVEPKSGESRFFMGLFLSRDKRYGAAIEFFKGLAREGSTNAWVYKYLAEAQMFIGEQDEALANFEKGISLAPKEANFRANFLYSTNAMPSLDEGRVSREHLEYGQQQEQLIQAVPHKVPDGRPEKLRIGFISGEFRCHSITYFFLPLLRGIDKERYEVFCYSDTEKEDSYTEQIKALSDGWKETHKAASESVLKWVQQDNVDILVDLNGYTGRFRFELFAAKAAPIQLSYLGYPNTTGLRRMDFRIADEWTDPEAWGNERYSETLLRLPGGFLCFEADPDAPDPERDTKAVPEICFGSFNAFQKVNAGVVDAWAKILRRVEGSSLLIKSFSFKEKDLRRRLKKQFEGLGVDGKRLILLDHTPSRREHLGLYSRVDIHLDTFPYNGTTTTCEALWQGVPTVTFKGNSHRARVGNSILSQLGLTQFIGENLDEYIEIAVAQAGKVEELREQRGALREQMLASPLMSVERFARDFSEAIEEMFFRYLKSGGQSK